MRRNHLRGPLAWAVPLAVATLAPATALAQEAVTGKGVEVSDGTVLHPNVGAELGFIDNLFFEQNGVVTTGMFRLSAKFDLASAEPEEVDILPGEETEADETPSPPTFTFKAGGGIAYEEFLYYDNEATTSQRNLQFDTQAHLQVYPQGTWSFLVDDRLRRDVRPRNFEDTSSTNRIDNHLDLGLRYQPGGRSITGTLRYANELDVFEGSERVDNRMNHTLGLRADWQWLPFTRFYSDLSYGFFGAIGDAASDMAGAIDKNSSNPLRGLVGVATTLSEPLTAKVQVGWGWSPYSQGEGYNAPIFNAELGWEYLPTGRVVAEYAYDHADSVNANYHSDHKFGVRIDQQLIDRLVLTGALDIRLRGYRGVFVNGTEEARDDFVFAGRGRAQYVLTDRYYLTGEYIGSAVATSFRYVTLDGAMDDPSYTRHELLFGARAAF